MISIVIPTLNEEKILERMLKALRVLDSVPYEIIVSDGGSTDGTVAIAKKYADKVVEHDSKSRQTIGIGRNDGAAVASGDILLFLDADVFIPEINDFFVEVTKQFETDQKLVGLTVFLKVLPEHVTLSDRLFFGIVNRLHQINNNCFHMGSASGEFMMLRANKFRQLAGFNEKLVVGEDNDLFARLSKLGRTRIETGLHVFHTSRRAHDIGWYKLLPLWVINFVYIRLFKKSLSKEWKVIR